MERVREKAFDTAQKKMREEEAPLLVSSGTRAEGASGSAWGNAVGLVCFAGVVAVAGVAALGWGGGNTLGSRASDGVSASLGAARLDAFVKNEFSSFEPGCEADLRHNQCGPYGEFCGCMDIKEGVAAATGRAIADVLQHTNIFLVGDSTSKMAVQHGCRTLLDPLQDPHGASCFREDGMPTVYDIPANLRPLRPDPLSLSVADRCCEDGASLETGGSCCMTMLESMVGGWCGVKDAATGELGGLGFVHMASSFKDVPEVPCEYTHGAFMPTPFRERAAAAVNQFAKHVRASSASAQRRTVVMIDVNVWMGLEENVDRYYAQIIDQTREAIWASQLPNDRTTLMLKTLYQCAKDEQWHCSVNNAAARRAAEAKGVPVFDFAETFDRKGLSPETALRHDGIHQMPETALYELYAMLDFVKEYHAKENGAAGM